MNTTAVWGERLNSGIVIKIRMSYKEGETLKHIESMDGVCSKNEPFSKNRWVEEVKNRTMIELTIKQHSKNVPVVIENILYYELRKKEGWNWPDLWHIMDDPSGIQIFSKVTSSSPLQWNTYPLTRMIYKEGGKTLKLTKFVAHRGQLSRRLVKSLLSSLDGGRYNTPVTHFYAPQRDWSFELNPREITWLNTGNRRKKRKAKTYGIDRNVWISEFGDS